MRNLVEPPPSLHCDRCRGELRLKQVTKSARRGLDLVEEIFVCVSCGRELTYIVKHDNNMGHLKAS